MQRLGAKPSLGSTDTYPHTHTHPERERELKMTNPISSCVQGAIPGHIPPESRYGAAHRSRHKHEETDPLPVPMPLWRQRKSRRGDREAFLQRVKISSCPVLVLNVSVKPPASHYVTFKSKVGK